MGAREHGVNARESAQKKERGVNERSVTRNCVSAQCAQRECGAGECQEYEQCAINTEMCERSVREERNNTTEKRDSVCAGMCGQQWRT